MSRLSRRRHCDARCRLFWRQRAQGQGRGREKPGLQSERSPRGRLKFIRFLRIQVRNVKRPLIRAMSSLLDIFFQIHSAGERVGEEDRRSQYRPHESRSSSRPEGGGQGQRRPRKNKLFVIFLNLLHWKCTHSSI